MKWSKWAWSAAENTYTGAGKRVKVFSADEIEAFARMFQLPVGWFFLPPDDGEGVGIAEAKAPSLNAGEQLELVFPFEVTGDGYGAIHERVEELFASPPRNAQRLSSRWPRA